MDSFPPRLTGLPPTSGGFYSRTKKGRSLSSPKLRGNSSDSIIDISALHPQESTLKSECDIPEKFPRYSPSKDEKSKNMRDSTLKLPSINNRPTLVASFDDILVYKSEEELSELIPGGRHISTQTTVNINRLELEDLPQYQKWMHHTVDPFFKDMRKAVLANKPDDLPSYCAQYCLALMNNVSTPETVFADPVSESPPKPTKNYVNRENCLIRVRNEIKSNNPSS